MWFQVYIDFYTDKWLDLEGAFVTYSLVAIWWQFFEFSMQ